MAYFDNNATTPLNTKAFKAFTDNLKICANPSASNEEGKLAAAGIENVRKLLTKYCKLKDTKILFTSGATESNCMIIRSLLTSFTCAIEKLPQEKRFKPHIICSKIEHHSILECLASVASAIELTEIEPDECGRITASAVEEAIRKNTLLITVMAANNETGVINEFQAIGKLARKNGVVFHTDATQLFGKYPIGTDYADAVSVSCHKWGGPKGVGYLFIRDSLIKNYKITGQISGTQQFGLRGGTENVSGIIASGVAFVQNFIKRKEKNEKLSKLQQTLMEFLRKNYEVYDNRDIKMLTEPGKSDKTAKIIIIGCGQKLENTILLSVVKYNFCNIKFKKALEEKKFICSIGSACNTKNPKPSHVLYAMKIPPFVRSGVIRISFGDQNTLKEVREFCKVFSELV